MKKKINVNHEEKMNTLLETFQRPYKARLVWLKDIKRLIKEVEQKLVYLNEKEKQGCSFIFMEHVNCNRYNKIAWYALSTSVEITRGKKDWFLTNICRVTLPTRKNVGDNLRIYFTEKAREKTKRELYLKFMNS